MNICALHDLYTLVGGGISFFSSSSSSSSSSLFFMFLIYHTSPIHVFCVLYVSMRNGDCE